VESKPLDVLAREKWRASGITDDIASKLKFKILSGADTQKLSSNFSKAGALLIPYFDDLGKPTKFYRIRYLERLPGFEGAVEKPQRYAQPAKTLNEVYLPPLLERHWRSLLQDPDVDLYITEGELKASSGCLAGLATMGLGGVDVWRSAKRGIQLLPSLASAVWENRSVTIVFDSDAATNPNVVRAQRQLAQELLAQGALPRIGSLPPAADGKKQGLDDFLVANGAQALETLLADSPAFAEAEALWALNEEVVYVWDPGIVVVRETAQKMSPNNFVQHAYANRHYLSTKETKKGVSSEKKPLAKRWMEWEHRFELNQITYAPGKPQLHESKWNTWEGWGVEPKKGDISPWTELINFLFRNESSATIEWFMKWCAYPLQHPGTKLFSSAVIWGAYHGTGKTLVAYTLGKIYGKNFIEIKEKDLHGSFNDWAENKQLVYGDEITGSDKRADADHLKGLITQHQLKVNVKYIPSYVVPDCVNYIFTSQHPNAFFLDDHDRRFFVHEVVGEPASEQFYKSYDKWMHGDGPAHLFHHLLRLDLTGFNPKAPALVTKSKTAMIVDNKSDLGMWVLRLREDPTTAIRTLGEAVSQKADLLSINQLLKAYDPEGATPVTVNGVARELKRSGFRQANAGLPIKCAEPYGVQRLYVVRNTDKWFKAKPADCAKHFNELFTTRKY
jgi:hypothetical protein